MSKNLIRKIISLLLFIIILFFLYRILLSSGFNFEDTKTIINAGALLFSVFFLFLLTFTFQTEVVYKEKPGFDKKTDSEQEEKTVIKSKTAEKIKNIINDTEDAKNFGKDLLSAFAKQFYIVRGMLYVKENNIFRLKETYADYPGKKIEEFKEGEGITGQIAKDKKIKEITEIPEDFITVVSGLGAGNPNNLIIIPFVKNNETVAVLEAAAFEKFPGDLEEYHSELNKLADKFKS